jgi:hypothetical protein
LAPITACHWACVTSVVCKQNPLLSVTSRPTLNDPGSIWTNFMPTELVNSRGGACASAPSATISGTNPLRN